MKQRMLRCGYGFLITVLSLVLARKIYLSEQLGDLSRKYIPYEFWMGWDDLLGVSTPEGKDNVGLFVLFLASLMIIAPLWFSISSYLRRRASTKR